MTEEEALATQSYNLMLRNTRIFNNSIIRSRFLSRDN